MTEAFNVDCMEYMRTLPDNAFDLAVVDPPYGFGLTDNGGCQGWFAKYNQDAADTHTHTAQPIWREIRQVQTSNRFGGRFERYGAKKSIAWDVAPEQEYFVELFRVSRNQIIWGGNYFDLPPTRCFLIWRKTNIPLEGFSMAPVEYAWTSFDENAAMFEYSSLRDETSGKFHPAEKPIMLYEWIYRHYAKEGDHILDTHLGSGSSRIAAHNMGFDFVGCEIDQTYFEQQEKRFADHTAQLSFFV